MTAQKKHNCDQATTQEEVLLFSQPLSPGYSGTTGLTVKTLHAKEKKNGADWTSKTVAGNRAAWYGDYFDRYCDCDIICDYYELLKEL